MPVGSVYLAGRAIGQLSGCSSTLGHRHVVGPAQFEQTQVVARTPDPRRRCRRWRRCRSASASGLASRYTNAIASSTPVSTSAKTGSHRGNDTGALIAPGRSEGDDQDVTQRRPAGSSRPNRRDSMQGAAIVAQHQTCRVRRASSSASGDQSSRTPYSRRRCALLRPISSELTRVTPSRCRPSGVGCARRRRIDAERMHLDVPCRHVVERIGQPSQQFSNLASKGSSANASVSGSNSRSRSM